MASAVLAARFLPLLMLVAGVVFSEGAPNVVPEFTDLVKVFGDVCGFPLSGDIHNDQFTATSFLPGHEPHFARFNQGFPGWMPAESDVGQWIQVRLSSTVYVTGILTQGSPLNEFYVTEYKVEYKPEGKTEPSCVMDMHGHPKIYKGNVDNSTPNINQFRPALSANYIRIIPLKWVGAIAMRLEIFGGGCEKCWQE